MREFLERVRAFPDWRQHEWLGAGLMLVGFLHITLGIALLWRAS